jgi:cell fate regulator YaaT (PSP1 superfamily)
MLRVVGVKLKPVGKIYFFDPAGLELKEGEEVVVETEKGLALGRVVWGQREVEEGNIIETLKPVVRKAQAEDLHHAQELQAKAGEALNKAREIIAKSGLSIKPVKAEYNWDGSRLIIYFTAPGRVDFRGLVKELASHFKTRIELHQLGARDEAKILGGIGPCGLPLCCSRWLCEFSPVSLRMAKEQELPLHPEKLSGLCGRLLCCLAFEMEQYCQLKEKLPKKGERLTTPMGPAEVVSTNPLKQTVTVELESQVVVEFPLSQVSLL